MVNYGLISLTGNRRSYQFTSVMHVYERDLLGIIGMGFLQAGCPFCHLTNNKNTDPS